MELARDRRINITNSPCMIGQLKLVFTGKNIPWGPCKNQNICAVSPAFEPERNYRKAAYNFLQYNSISIVPNFTKY